MTIDSKANSQTTFGEAHTLEELGSFISSVSSYEGPPLSEYVPSLSELTDTLYEKLTSLKRISESSEHLQELSSKISSYIQQIKKYQETSKENNATVEKVSETLTEFKKELDTPKVSTDLADDFELLCEEGEGEEYTMPQDLPPSLLYFLYDNTRDASRTASLMAYTYLFSTTVEDVIEEADDIPEEYFITIKSLIENLGGRLSTREVIDFINALSCSTLYEDRATFMGTGLVNKHSIEGRSPSELIDSFMDNRETRKSIEETGSPRVDLVFIPFVFKGSYALDLIPYVDTGHIVLITVCFSEQTVEYFDSFGYTPESWTCYQNFNMKEELENIKDKYFENDEGLVLSTPFKQQHDWHSCGVFVIWYIIQRLNGVPYQKIVTTPMTVDDIETIRLELAKLLASPKRFDKKINITVPSDNKNNETS
jgi:Ulp1 protease family, C-terminal catalytic domain